MNKTFGLLLLALVKLHVNKLSMIITVAIAVILFGLIIASAMIADGFVMSMSNFRDNGLNDRLIVRAVPSYNEITNGLMSDKNLIKKARELYQKEQQEKQQYASEVGAIYSPNQDRPPVISTFGGESDGRLDPSSLIARQVIEDYRHTNPKPGLSELKTLAEDYYPKSFFEEMSVAPKNGELRYIADSSDTKDHQDGSFDLMALRLLPPELYQPFMFDNLGWSPSSGRIPIILSVSDVKKVTGVTFEKDGAASSELALKQLKEVYSRSRGLVFEACYQNDVLLQDIADDENEGDSCSPKKKYNKDITDEQIKFNKKFAIEYKPIQKVFKFEVVGVAPDPTDAESDIRDASSAIRSVVRGATITTSVPRDLFNRMDNKQQYDDLIENRVIWPFGTTDKGYYVEFANKDDALKFIDENSCHNSSAGLCLPESKPFNLSMYDTASFAFADIKTKTSEVYLIASIVIAVFSAIIVSALVVRTVLYTKQESAIYRAIGFSRSQVASVYVIYSMLLSLIVAILSLGIGALLATLTSNVLVKELTVQAQLAFGLSASSSEFSLIGFPIINIAGVAVLVFATGFVAALLAAAMAMGRNVSKDLRSQ